MSNHENDISLIKQSLDKESQSFFDDKTILRFLHSRNYDIKKTLILLNEDIKWRKAMQIDKLNISHVQQQLKTGKFVLPGIVDKENRPIIIFNAGKHNPNDNLLETVKLAVYGFELAINSMSDGVEQLTIIENLDGFTKDNADNRMVKFLVEVLQAHYPGRLGLFVAVNAPWYYRLLFKVVKPWLSGDLLSKVNIYTSTDSLLQYLDKDQIITELGGNFKFNLNKWIETQVEKEKVDLQNPIPFEFAPQIIAVFSDIPAKTLKLNAIRHGWMKKQGGFVKKFNKRYCILTETIFYYYKEENGNKPEGFVELPGSKISSHKGNVFCITTAVQKHCIFSTSESEFKDWFNLLSNTISSLNNDNDIFSSSDVNISLTQSTYGYNLQDDNVSKLLCKNPKELEIVFEKAQMPNGGVKQMKHKNSSKNCFLGSDLASWLIDSSIVQSKDVSTSFAQLLLDEYYIFPIENPGSFISDKTYSFRDFSQKSSFNLISLPNCVSTENPLKIIKDNYSFFTGLLKENFSNKEDFTSENILSFKRSKSYRLFSTSISDLQELSLSILNVDELILFSILLFRLLSLHALIDLSNQMNHKLHNKNSILRNISYTVGNNEISLDDIEFGNIFKSLSISNDISSKLIFSYYPGYYDDDYPFNSNISNDINIILQESTNKFIEQTFKYNEKKNIILIPEFLSNHFKLKKNNKTIQKIIDNITNNELKVKWQEIVNKSPKVKLQKYQHEGFYFINAI